MFLCSEKTHRARAQAEIWYTHAVPFFFFFLSVLTGVKCWNPDWLRWIFVKISKRKAHVLWGRFTAIITERSRLHLPHANWWQANQQHALKTTVPLCWHCCRSLTAFPPPFFLNLSVSLSLFLSPSLAPSVSLPLSSLHLLQLYHISLFFFLFAPERSFSPVLLLFPLLLFHSLIPLCTQGHVVQAR